ncbi:MAG: class I adenylate-forming enzyme family protein [Bacteroidota bacterium]
MPLYDQALLAPLRQFPADQAALVKGNEKIYAQEIYQQAQRLAQNLLEQGMKSGDRVAMASSPGPDFLVIIYAMVMIRAQVAIIDPEMGRDHYRAKLQQLSPTWAFVDSRLLLLQEHPILRWAYFRWKKRGLYFPRQQQTTHIATGPRLPLLMPHLTLRNLLRKPQAPSLEKDPGDAPFLITYTSGTVAEPKGVLHGFQSLGESIQQIVKLLAPKPGQRVATHLPHFMLIGLAAGIPIHLWDYDQDVDYKLGFIQKHQITTLFGPPSDYLPLIRACEATQSQLPACLTHVLLGSAPVHASFLRRLVAVLRDHVRITALYGMTENLLVATADGREKATWEGQGDLLGRAAAGVELEIAEDGEILLESPQLFQRYFHLDSRETPHRSGDLGYLNEQGELVLTGRKKDMIIRRNTNLYPGLYEPTINRIPGVTQAVMIGVYNEKKSDEEVFLVVEPEPAANGLDLDNLKSCLEYGRYSIDKEAWPDYILTRELPRSGRQNKVDRKRLQRDLQAKTDH